MYEHRSEPLLERRAFLRRLASSATLGFGVIVLSLYLGMLGYHRFERLTWIDSFLNASMLLGGMGPVEQPQTFGGKLFAGLYAIYCGLALISATGVMIAPVIHRVMHKFHLEQNARR
jgi:hypothetical protein